MSTSPRILPRKLDVTIGASIVLSVAGLLNQFTLLVLAFMPLSIIFFLVGVCGLFCGITAAIAHRGFERRVAVAGSLVSLYSLVVLFHTIRGILLLP
jgi:hypothetical protein